MDPAESTEAVLLSDQSPSWRQAIIPAIFYLVGLIGFAAVARVWWNAMRRIKIAESEQH